MPDLSTCHVDTGDALPLLFALARHAAREDQLMVLDGLVALLQDNVTNLLLLDKYADDAYAEAQTRASGKSALL